MHRRRVSWLWWMATWIAAGLFAACQPTDPATEVLVVVESDLALGSELSKLHVEMFEGNDATARKHDFNLAAKPTRANEYNLPLSFSLVPAGAGAPKFRVVVTGRARGADNELTDVVERRVSGQFTANMRTRLDIRLERSCLAVLCREGGTGKTCSGGACVVVRTEPLPTATEDDFGGFTAHPAGLDAGKRDARVPPQAETGPSPQCKDDNECEAKLSVAEPAGCAVATCSAGTCVFTSVDADGDNHRSANCSLGNLPIERGDDCDDYDSARFPTAWDGPVVEGMFADACDGRDNDCDEKVDEERHDGKSCMCDPASDVQADCSLRADDTPIRWPAGTPVGGCQYGKRSCKDGVWGKCTGAVEPKEKDSCQPDDDSDCDGQRNEDCACVNGEQRPCGSDVGSCQTGMQTCSGAKWSATCVGSVMPAAADTCDMGNDNNCNGKANEGCTCINQTTSTCGKTVSSKGVCANRAVTCKEGKWDTSVCTMVDVEVCTDNGQDEDCDGQVNETASCQCTNGKTQLCGLAILGTLGACAAGRTTCVNGRWGGCNVGPQLRDTCSPLGGDENCNGRQWEGCECVERTNDDCNVGDCTGGTKTCRTGGTWGECKNAVCPQPTGDGGV
ncbi:MAG: hypothetical protein RLZZ450_3834 [Pseudomonadota bacterium]